MKKLLLLILLLGCAYLFFSGKGEKSAARPKSTPTKAEQPASPVNLLPNPVPPFHAASLVRQTPVLKVGQFEWEGKLWRQPSFCVGSKHVGVREVYRRANSDQSVGIVVDDATILNISFWGGGGIPFKPKDGTTPELTFDEKAQTISYSIQYLLPNGETATYSHTLKPLADSQVELSWDLGINQEKLNALPADFRGVSVWLPSDANVCHKGQFVLNRQPMTLKQKEQLGDTDSALGEGDGVELVYAPDRPLESFTVKLPEKYHHVASENMRGMIIRAATRERESHGSLIIDLGVAPAKDPNAPEPVAGIDFWQSDAMCVPAPATRNLLSNPGFEQGLHYWKWWNNGQNLPTEQPKFSVASDDAKEGRKALHINSGPGSPMLSFPIPLLKGKTYTVSFYAKAAKPGSDLTVGIMSAVLHSEFNWMKALSTKFPITTEWTRYSHTFTADMEGAMVAIFTYAECWVDGIQLEEGPQPSQFIAPAVQGTLVTSDPDNNLSLGAPIDAAFTLSGEPGVKGEVTLTLVNFYREKLFNGKGAFTLDPNGAARVPLPLDPKKLGTGVFVLQADYKLADGTTLRDYFRLSVMDFLENKHATKDLFGTLGAVPCVTRPEELARNMMRWGFGSKTYSVRNPEQAALYEKYGIGDFLALASEMGTDEQNEKLKQAERSWKEIPPDGEKMIEETVYEVVKSRPWQKSWAFTTETEGKAPLITQGKMDQWGRVLQAFHRGVKRANPDAIVLPDGGTSGFGRLRGFRETEAYFAATQGKVKWDAVATHPYGVVDGMDEVSDLLIAMMQKYGYGKETPIDYTEGFNIPETHILEWGDDGCYDHYQAGKPSYDFGWAEFMQASQVARIYITCLKYWPQVRSFNIWVSAPFMDQNLTPLALCKVPNTLGHLFAKPKYVADVQPAAGVRGYVFEDDQGRGVAALWTNIPRVEQGSDRGPVMNVRFEGAPPEFIDLMGNARPVTPPKDGVVAIQLTPAPLFIRSAKGSAAQLAAALNRGEVAGAASSVRVAVQPSLGGALEATVSNITNRPMKGTLSLADNQLAFDIPAKGKIHSQLPDKISPVTGKLFSWKKSLGLKIGAEKEQPVDWDLSFFYIPHTAVPLPLDPAAPQWQAIPAIPLNNWCVQKTQGIPPVKAGYEGDLDVKFQLAWDRDNLYLRISAKDDQFVLAAPERWKYAPDKDSQLYVHDGCAEVYFDTGANGRSNLVKGFDADDYRYDFYAGGADAASGPGSVYRFREPYHQLAGGIDMPKKTDAAKGVQCRFERTASGYAYVMIFPQKYIEPLKLEKGWLAGFGLYLHDNDDPQQEGPKKGLSLATRPGTPCDNVPELWPIMILGE